MDTAPLGPSRSESYSVHQSPVDLPGSCVWPLGVRGVGKRFEYVGHRRPTIGNPRQTTDMNGEEGKNTILENRFKYKINISVWFFLSLSLQPLDVLYSIRYHLRLSCWSKTPSPTVTPVGCLLGGDGPVP